MRKPIVLVALSVVVLLAVGVGGFGWYYYYGPCGVNRVSNALDEMTAISDDWETAVTLAGSAPRIALLGPIKDLHDLRRDAGEIEAPACMLKVHANLLASMDSTLDGFQAFAGQEEDFVVSNYFSRATDQLEDYSREVKSVKACMPFCK